MKGEQAKVKLNLGAIEDLGSAFVPLDSVVKRGCNQSYNLFPELKNRLTTLASLSKALP